MQRSGKAGRGGRSPGKGRQAGGRWGWQVRQQWGGFNRIGKWGRQVGWQVNNNCMSPPVAGYGRQACLPAHWQQVQHNNNNGNNTTKWQAGRW